MARKPTYEELEQRVKELEKAEFERKRAVDVLRESEPRFQSKFDSDLLPNGEVDTVTLNLANIIDTQAIQSIMDDFFNLTNIGIAILDLYGKILVATGWQDICTQFHRIDPETCKNCLESDLELSNGVEPGTFRLYRCKNNMWDMATPIIVGDKHVGNLYLGQFFFEDETPDLEVFRSQAQKYGFNEEKYLAAFERVPRWSRETVNAAMAFYTKLAHLISNLSYSNIRITQILMERNNLLNSLQESKERYVALFERSLDCVYIHDFGGNFIDANLAALNLLGYTKEEIPSLNFVSLLSQDQIPFALRILEEVKTKGFQKDLAEFKLRTKSGEDVFVEAKSSVIYRDGMPYAIQGIARDITDRKVAEDTLRQSEDRIRAILRASPLGIGLFVNRKLDWANERFYHLVGHEEGSLIGQDARVVYPDDEAYDQTGRELYEGTEESGTNEVETELIRKDGTTFDCSMRACPLDPKDPFKGQIVTIADISEAKRLAAQFRQAQKMEAVGRLAGGVAHDFNNLLMSIMGHADLALMSLAEDDPLRRRLKEIKGGGKRAASLTRQLLAFSRKQILQPVVLDLNSLITGFVKMLERMIGEDVELETVLASGLSRVEADPGQMEQIIMNLVVNARDSMPDGGKLIIETVNVDLDKDYAKEHDVSMQPGPHVMLGVSDTGMGMDDKTKSHIFEPFFTTKEVGKGTGLGLSTVYGIVKQSGGYIWVYSEPGQGTTFKIYLPAVEREAAQVQEEQTSSDDFTGSETILIVEDDDSLRNMVCEILEPQGYSILEAQNGIEALRVSESHSGQIHLMLTDVVMPKMGGRELEEHLRPLRPDMKVIYMSEYTDNAILHHGVLSPGIEFLEKPFTPAGLRKKVREVLDE